MPALIVAWASQWDPLAVFCGVLCCLNGVGLSLPAVIFASISFPHSAVPLTYAALSYLLQMPIDSRGPLTDPSEAHSLALLLASALVAPSSVRFVFLPVAALLPLAPLLSMLPPPPRFSSFVALLVVSVVATLIASGDPLSYLQWAVEALRLASRDAAIAALIAATGLVPVVFMLQGGSPAQRKVFHLIMIAMALAVRNVSYLGMGAALGICILIVLEAFRHYLHHQWVAQSLNVWFSKWIDAKDSRRPIATTHIYLLIGCTLGFWRSDMPCHVQFGGLAAVGMGDAAAAIVGSRWGRIRYYKGGKSLEGSVAMFVSMVMFLISTCGNQSWLSIVSLSAAATIAEALLANDNLLVGIIASSSSFQRVA